MPALPLAALPYELQLPIVELALMFQDPIRIHDWLYSKPSDDPDEQKRPRTKYRAIVKSHKAITQTCKHFRELSHIYYARNTFAFPESRTEDDRYTISRFIRQAGPSNCKVITSIAIPARLWQI